MDFELEIVPLKFSLRFILKNISKSSSKIMSNVALPLPPALLRHSIETDLLASSLNVVESIDSRQ